MNAVTKSGANSSHGTASEFLRNQKLDSRNFFDYNQVNPVTGQEIPNTAIGLFRRNQFGGVVGGPIFGGLFGYSQWNVLGGGSFNGVFRFNGMNY
jgi:hypothetical protein